MNARFSRPEISAGATGSAPAEIGSASVPTTEVWECDVAENEVEATVQALAAQGRLADFFGTIEEDQLMLRIVDGFEPHGGYRILKWAVDNYYAKLSDIAPAAFVEECEIYEQFGARPAGDETLNRLVVPPHSGRDFPRLGHPPAKDPAPVHAPHYVSGEALEFPVGPVRAVAQESLYIGLVTSGEEVIDLYLLQWHKHRGIERRLRGLRPDGALFFVERAEGLSAVANGWAFCRAAETIAGVELGDGVERSRGVALELERIYNHTAAIAALGQATGLSVGQAQVEITLERLLRLNAAVFGHRYLFGVLSVGGVTRRPDVDRIRTELPIALDELRRVVKALLSTNSFVDRLEACGIVAPEAAHRLGLVGPVARGSDQNLDCRRDHPFGPYVSHCPAVVVRQSGDVLARMEVMVSEIEDSAHLVMDLLDAGTGEGIMEVPLGAGSALGWCESTRGESLVWLALDEAGHVQRARLRPGSVRNWRAFDDAARSRNVFTDVPIIEASFWLTVAGFAR
jgi:Ni,Fe-hydrogenase III large subunit